MPLCRKLVRVIALRESNILPSRALAIRPSPMDASMNAQPRPRHSSTDRSPFPTSLLTPDDAAPRSGQTQQTFFADPENEPTKSTLTSILSTPSRTPSFVSDNESSQTQGSNKRRSYRAEMDSLSDITNIISNDIKPRRETAAPSPAAERDVNYDLQRTLALRRWEVGDVYAPRDMSYSSIRKATQNRNLRPGRDVFDILGVNPLDEWKNPLFVAEFTTMTGRIRSSKQTGLRPVNQRKMARAVRRAIGMGIFPSVHVHPEMLRRSGPWRYPET